MTEHEPKPRRISWGTAAAFGVPLLAFTALSWGISGKDVHTLSPDEPLHGVTPEQNVSVRYGGVHAHVGGNEYRGSDCLADELTPPAQWEVSNSQVTAPLVGGQTARFVINNGMVQPSNEVAQVAVAANNCPGYQSS